eukprot:CAMPEP_0170581472 /NCGR_PEP_ID=MMETSP0224-20130122/7056_1 /TAXON_ID=285029 /ORGANISM="Togula jolla, Strain CCCM 725" /LENGTH=136 /DNA_ID=CAMNT_0010904607 /DNA_START=940 /DNA_END=1351 /DNA_ORIENTATION=+
MRATMQRQSMLAIGAPVDRVKPGLDEEVAAQHVPEFRKVAFHPNDDNEHAKAHCHPGGQHDPAHTSDVVGLDLIPSAQNARSIDPLGDETAHDDEKVHGHVPTVTRCREAAIHQTRKKVAANDPGRCQTTRAIEVI